MQRLGLVVKQLDEIVKMIGVTSEMGAAVSEMIKKASKYVQPGSLTPTAETNGINQLAMKSQANNQQMQQYMASKQAGAGGQAKAA
jgi:hypothetical protein